MKTTRAFLLTYLFFICAVPFVYAQNYETLLQAARNAEDEKRPIPPGLSAEQARVRSAWTVGKLIDIYLLELNASAGPLIGRLTQDLKSDPSRLYYALQFARNYPDAPPTLDLPWGFYQYLLAVNDPGERNALAERAVTEKWNWDKLRLEVKLATRDNKEFVFTETPAKPGSYRIVKAKKGPHRGELVLDLGFSNDYKFPKIKFQEYEIVQAKCRTPFFGGASACVLKPAPARSEAALFTYQAYVMHVIDGDTFQALVDLGFGMTTRQTFRLWGLDAPEMNTKEGRKAKKILENFLLPKPILLRAIKTEKFGRYLADVWSVAQETTAPVYINQTLIDQQLASARER